MGLFDFLLRDRSSGISDPYKLMNAPDTTATNSAISRQTTPNAPGLFDNLPKDWMDKLTAGVKQIEGPQQQLPAPPMAPVLPAMQFGSPAAGGGGMSDPLIQMLLKLLSAQRGGGGAI